MQDENGVYMHPFKFSEDLINHIDQELQKSGLLKNNQEICERLIASMRQKNALISKEELSKFFIKNENAMKNLASLINLKAAFEKNYRKWVSKHTPLSKQKDRDLNLENIDNDNINSNVDNNDSDLDSTVESNVYNTDDENR